MYCGLTLIVISFSFIICRVHRFNYYIVHLAGSVFLSPLQGRSEGATISLAGEMLDGLRDLCICILVSSTSGIVSLPRD
jgi:hypothetical protein